jgi:hypothetical protein
VAAVLDSDGWPTVLQVQTGMQADGFGPEASFDIASRYFVPNYRFSNCKLGQPLLFGKI